MIAQQTSRRARAARGWFRMHRPTSSPLNRVRRLAFALLALAGFAVAAGHATRAGAAEFGALEIVTRTGVQVFQVELAVSDEERATGLMHRRELPEGRGMLFDFFPPREVVMWMKNTYVSLDMIFIRADGRIHRIAENTEPLSTRHIQSQGAVAAVLEVVAGTSKRLGIAPGDQVAHPIFAKARRR